MAERPIQNFDERSDLIPTSNISPINPPIRSMLCPVLCWIRCRMALRSAGALRFPRSGIVFARNVCRKPHRNTKAGCVIR